MFQLFEWVHSIPAVCWMEIILTLCITWYKSFITCDTKEQTDSFSLLKNNSNEVFNGYRMLKLIRYKWISNRKPIQILWNGVQAYDESALPLCDPANVCLMLTRELSQCALMQHTPFIDRCGVLAKYELMAKCWLVMANSSRSPFFFAPVRTCCKVKVMLADQGSFVDTALQQSRCSFVIHGLYCN